MSGEGTPDLGVTDTVGLRIGLVVTMWHRDILDALEAGALRALKDAGSPEPTIVRVPGAFELPIAAQALAAGHDAVVALGVVIRGGTPHFEYVCSAATDGLLRVSLDTNVPVGFGLLTCDTTEQAWDRAGVEGSREDKGYEVAAAAVATALTLRGLAHL